MTTLRSNVSQLTICEARYELGPLVLAPEGAKTREFMNGGPEHPARRGRSLEA